MIDPSIANHMIDKEESLVRGKKYLLSSQVERLDLKSKCDSNDKIIRCYSRENYVVCPNPDDEARSSLVKLLYVADDFTDYTIKCISKKDFDDSNIWEPDAGRWIKPTEEALKLTRDSLREEIENGAVDWRKEKVFTKELVSIIPDKDIRAFIYDDRIVLGKCKDEICHNINPNDKSIIKWKDASRVLPMGITERIKSTEWYEKILNFFISPGYTSEPLRKINLSGRINFDDVLCDFGDKKCIRGYYLTDKSPRECKSFEKDDYGFVSFRVFNEYTTHLPNDVNWIAADFKKDAWVCPVNGRSFMRDEIYYYNTCMKLKDYVKTNKLYFRIHGGEIPLYADYIATNKTSNGIGQSSMLRDYREWKRNNVWYRKILSNIRDFFIGSGHASDIRSFNDNDVEKSTNFTTLIGIEGRALSRAIHFSENQILNTVDIKPSTLNILKNSSISLSYAIGGSSIANADDKLKQASVVSSQIFGVNAGSNIARHASTYTRRFVGGTAGGITASVIMNTMVNVDPKVSLTYGTATAFVLAKPTLNYIRFGQFKTVETLLPSSNPITFPKVLKLPEILKMEIRFPKTLIYNINDKGKLSIAKVDIRKVSFKDFTPTSRTSIAQGRLNITDKKIFYELYKGSFNVNDHVMKRHGIASDGTYTRRVVQAVKTVSKAGGVIGFYLGGVGITSEEFPKFSPAALGLTGLAGAYPPILAVGTGAILFKPLGDAMQKGADVTEEHLFHHPSTQIPMPINGVTAEQYLVAGRMMGKGFSIVGDAVLTTLRWTKEKIDKGLKIAGNMIVPVTNAGYITLPEVEVIPVGKMSWDIYQGKHEEFKMSISEDVTLNNESTISEDVTHDKIKLDNSNKIELGSPSQWLQTASHLMKTMGNQHIASKLMTGGMAANLITKRTSSPIISGINVISAISMIVSLFQDEEKKISQVATSIQESTEALSQQIGEVYSSLRNQGINILDHIDKIKLESLSKFLEASKEQVEISKDLHGMYEDIVKRIDNGNNLVINIYNLLRITVPAYDKLSPMFKEAILASQEDISLSTYQRIFRKIASINLLDPRYRDNILQNLYEKLTKGKIKPVPNLELLLGSVLVLTSLMNNQLSGKKPSQRTLISQWSHIKRILRFTCSIIDLMKSFKELLAKGVEIENTYLHKMLFNDSGKIDNPMINNIILTVAYLERNTTKDKWNLKTSCVKQTLDEWNELVSL